ncbi:tRNA (adenosine(37)-N6)-threonylcarbamoyltransferase complex transferase subunit TsaD [Helicobacter sp. 23-1044]
MILSIESSCDDSSLALTAIDSRKILFHQKISQDANHAKYGGVVPEIASRLHSVNLPKILQRLSGNFDLRKIRAIAVTTEPGLSVSLLEGVMMAKALSASLQIPLISVNHLQGHIYSLFLENRAIFPLVILLLSGGHSLIIEAQSHTDLTIIAGTLDDSFGEAFDKVAKMLNLGYPGGVAVESCARGAVVKNIKFPIPLQNKDLAFSFSGLKNAVRLKIDSLISPSLAEIELTFSPSLAEIETTFSPSLAEGGRGWVDSAKLQKSQIDEICYGFQKSAIAHIAQKTRLYFERESRNKSSGAIKRFGVVGGASANLALRIELQKIAKEFDKEILFAPLEFCSDNAAMIGRCAIEAYHLGDFTALENLNISPKSTKF